ncbi:MAG: patatin-like phospholipase family protein [Nitrospira sp.]|nr:patatin-like phospholipase family protein [Nitrospira sp.]
MHDGLSNKYGNILFVFCGGGFKAIFQAAAATELVRAGLVPSHIMSSSAGTCNALGFVENPGIGGAEKTLRMPIHSPPFCTPMPDRHDHERP